MLDLGARPKQAQAELAPEPERMERAARAPAAPTRPEAAALKGLKSFFFQIVTMERGIPLCRTPADASATPTHPTHCSHSDAARVGEGGEGCQGGHQSGNRRGEGRSQGG